ncbi:MAG TPA: hypothetical protein RMH99_22335 [Sandaracinaceae bacterium LLY-WYZ-13_1]|nr:hypothetical protein [Sandaracinaceae bacterium LLY-WYZ-13_1]
MNEKIVVALFGGPADRAARRRLLVDELGPRLTEHGARRVQLCVADEAADVRGPTPFSPAGPEPVALLSVWGADVTRVLARLSEAGFGAHAWRVESDVYTDYGEHPLQGPRDWSDGTRSPTVTSVNFLERPRSMPLDAWLERWRGRMSPVSAAVQPRVRYVRNLLTEPLTEGAPGWQAIVEEVWPSPRHVANPFLFYGARGPFTLAVNMTRVLAAVLSFLRPWRVKTVMMSEYFVYTDGPDVPAERRA